MKAGVLATIGLAASLWAVWGVVGSRSVAGVGLPPAPSNGLIQPTDLQPAPRPSAVFEDTTPRRQGHSAPGAHPNEPSGFTPFADFNAGVVPPSQSRRRIEGKLGEWFALNPKNPRLTVQTDPTAPVSPPEVLSTRFPAGLKAGNGPVTWGGWDTLGRVEGQKSKLYLSLWIKIEGRDYENQQTGTKMGFIASALPLNKGAGTQAFLFLKNEEGRQAILSAFHVEVRQETGFRKNGGFNRNLAQNVVRDKLMTCGSWHQWELLLELNELGARNGVLKWWIDGRLVMDHRDVTYIFGPNTNGFWNWKWNPTWGGTAGVRTRDDVMLIDHVYMSGLKYEGPKVVGEPRPWDPQ